MNLGETKQYIDEQLSSLGWSIQIDRSGYENIHQHTHGDKDRVVQLYYKLVSLGAQRPKREINSEVVRAAIDDLTRMSAILDSPQGKPARHNNNQDHDRLSIEQLAKSLEMTAAAELKANHTSLSATSRPRGNGAHAAARKASGKSVLPTMLIVDDSPTIRAVVTRALERHFTIIQAENGEEAWSHLLSNNDIEIVVTDLMMPKLDGFGLISRIRTDRGAPHLHSLPIIVVTTLEDTNAKLRALVAGANDFITKNTETPELQARVLARYRLAQTLKEAEWKQIASRKSKPAASSNLANTSEPRAGMHASTSSRSTAGAHGQSAMQDPQLTARKFVDPETQEPVHFSVKKLDRSGAAKSNGMSRLSSTTGITLTATIVVAIIIAVIFYFRTHIVEVTEKPADIAQAGASAENQIGIDAPQQSAAKITAAVPPETANSSPNDDASQNVARGVVSETDKAVPKTEEQPTTPVRDASPEKVSAFQPEKSIYPSEPVGSTAKTKLPSRAAPAVTSAPKVVAQTQTPLQGQNSTGTAPAAVTAPTVVAQAQLPKAQFPADEPSAPDSVATPSPMSPEAQSLQQSGADASSSAMSDQTKPSAVVATIASMSGSSKQITQPELVTLLKRFVFVYQAGDIEQFLNLFANDVRTNDQTSKAGLRADYEDLFNTTDMRQMVLGNVTWDVNGNHANGWGNFEVKVRKTGHETIKAFNGSLTFHVEKIDGRLQIKKLYHGQWKAGG